MSGDSISTLFRRSLRSLCMVAACCVVLLVGCRSDSPEENTGSKPNLAGQTVTVVVPETEPFGQAWGASLEDWKAATGANWQLATEPNDDTSNVRLIDFDAVPDAVASGSLRPIPTGLRRGAEGLADDPLPGIERLVGFAGEPYLVPLSLPVPVLYYRADLLEQADREPPRTWSEYRELVESLDDWAPGKIAAEPWAEENRSTMFLLHTVCFARHPESLSLFFNYNSGKPRIGSPGFVAGTEELLTLWKSLPRECLDWTDEDVRTELFSGRAALGIGFVEPNRRSTEDNTGAEGIAAVPLPGADRVYNAFAESWVEPESGVNRVVVLGRNARFFAVQADATREAAGWSLLKHLASRLRAGTPAVIPTTPVRRADFQTPGPWSDRAFSARTNRDRLAAVETTLADSAIVPELAVVGREKFRDTLSVAVTELLTDPDANAETVLSDLENTWAEIVEKVGTDRLTDSYRASLGLSRLGSP